LAYRASWQLVKQPKEAVLLLGKHLTPAAAPDAAKIQAWLVDLSSTTFAVRDKAFKELENQGELAEERCARFWREIPSWKPSSVCKSFWIGSRGRLRCRTNCAGSARWKCWRPLVARRRRNCCSGWRR